MGRVNGDGQDPLGAYRVVGCVMDGHRIEFEKEYMGIRRMHFHGQFRGCHRIMEGTWGMGPG